MQRRFLLVFFLSLSMAACSSADGVDLKRGDFGLLYTSSIERDASFVVTDEQGEIQSSVNFKGRGVERIGSDGNGGYLLPATLGDETRAHVDHRGKLSVVAGYREHTFADTQEGVQVILYNTGMEENTIEIHKGDQVRKNALPSLTRSALVYGTHVYIAIDANKNSYLYIIDSESGKVKKRVRMPNQLGAADDMKLFQGKIVMATQGNSQGYSANHLLVFDPKTEEIKKVFLEKDTTPQFLAVDGDDLYVSTEEGFLFKLDRDYQVQKRVKEGEAEEDRYLQRIQIKGKKVYTLTTMPRGSEKRSGYIGIFDKQTMKRDKRVDLPIIRDTSVSDFVLLEKR